ncbi:MAG TPA: carotenoid biosynthesis protein [Myxococcota bacterium]|nr:carotenoid biosynthesis protein [Myxococcota bacterium]
MHTLELLAHTVALRPYVFGFLAAFLVIALGEIGPARTLVWLVLGYGVAFACEYTSTRNGFPFGLYHYFDAPTRGRELWVSNVPFMDSLSFVFLSFVGYAAARRLIGATPHPEGRIQLTPLLLGLGTLLMVAIDLVCDPVALRGDRWFLGKLYDYAEPGLFFGVPFTNYLGWTFVGAVVLAAMGALERAGWLRGAPLYSLPRGTVTAFYAAIVLFNAVIAFWIGLAPVGWLGLALVAAVTVASAFPFGLRSGGLSSEPGYEEAR